MQEYTEKFLELQEGYRQFPYKDTRGILTIGIGRNLEAKGLTLEESIYLMRNDIAEKEADLVKHVTFYNNLDDATKYVLINLCFNMGITRLLGFKNMLAAMAINNKGDAADELLDSDWADEVGETRSNQIATVLRTGVMS